jgi:hypothetical protein
MLTFAACWLLLQWGYTPLHRAAQYGHTEVVDQLLHAHAALDARDKVRPAPQQRVVVAAAGCGMG